MANTAEIQRYKIQYAKSYQTRSTKNYVYLIPIENWELGLVSVFLLCQPMNELKQEIPTWSKVVIYNLIGGKKILESQLEI